MIEKISKKLSEKEDDGTSIMEKVAKERVKKQIAIGAIIDPLLLSDFNIYRKAVWRYTNKNNLENLKNYDKRGRSDLKEDAHHLDHKYSIKEGFKNNIPTYIIGNIYNLEMIHYMENCSKQEKCSILLENLYIACHL